MTFRRLLRVVLPNLPRTSAFKQALNPAATAWGPAEYIAADLVDAVVIGNWQRENTGRDRPTERPAPYPRPGDVQQQLTEREERIAALQAQRERALAARGEGAE